MSKTKERKPANDAPVDVELRGVAHDKVTKKEKKRKRDDAGSEGHEKKLKKSKKDKISNDTPMEDGALDGAKQDKKDKKSKKRKASDEAAEDAAIAEADEKQEKKSKKSENTIETECDPIVVDDVPITVEAMAPVKDPTLQLDFIPFEDDFADPNKAKKERRERIAKKLKERQERKEKKAQEKKDMEAKKAQEKKEKKAKKDKNAPTVDGSVHTEERATEIEGVDTTQPRDGVDVAEDVALENAITGATLNLDEKKSRKAKKDKKASKGDELTTKEQPGTKVKEVDPAAQGDEEVPSEAAASKKDKKTLKTDKRHKKSSKIDDSAPKEELEPEVDDADTAPQEQNGEGEEDNQAGKKDRFIVFVGNLPYTTTKEELQKHFAKIAPTEIRVMTDKQTNKSKGFAWVEFDRYDRMQTCLKKYNHSVLPDGKKGRKINVELTAGGGGNTESRVFKIQTKNERLLNERQRDHKKREEIEAKRKERKEKKESRQKNGKQDGEVQNGAVGSDQPSSEHGVMHPSRLAMMNKPLPAWKQKSGRY